MTTLFIILIILSSVILSFFVLIQNPKGGGLSSGFSGGSNLMGVKRTGDFLEKGTWTLVIALLVFCLAINIMGPSAGAKGGLSDQIDAPMQSSTLNLNNIAPTEGEAPAAAAPVDSAE
jgi:preprotein translocase subunit SecG